MGKLAIAIHGGAGTIDKEKLSPELERAYKDGLRKSLEAGFEILKNGGSSLDAVQLAVKYLEDNELFNAGKGSVYTADSKIEMDAAIMDGRNLKAGSVASISSVRNPVDLARAVMERSEHVLLVGQGAVAFAKTHGVLCEADEYFYTEKRMEQLINAKRKKGIYLDHVDEKKFGTVGAVARDIYGNLAAATSTGGMTNKISGRVGDSPIIGAGTYANNNTCAISCTGHGEFFMRNLVAYDISCLIEYKGLSLRDACDKVVKDKLMKVGGEGGVIAVDSLGHLELVFNSQGMFRAWKNDKDDSGIEIW